MDFSNVLVILGCIIVLWIVAKIFSIPLKAIMKIVLNSILGGILIFIINLIGGAFSFHIGLNIGTAVLVGLLGIPRSNIINSAEIIYIKKYMCRTKKQKNKVTQYDFIFCYNFTQQ